MLGTGLRVQEEGYGWAPKPEPRGMAPLGTWAGHPGEARKAFGLTALLFIPETGWEGGKSQQFQPR